MCTAKRANALGEGQLCLVVDVVGPTEDNSTRKTEKNRENPKIISKPLSFLDHGKNRHVPFPASFIQERSDLPKPGTKLLIQITKIFSPSSLYAHYSTKESLHCFDGTLPELHQVQLMINNADSHENLQEKPVPGEMVLANDLNNRLCRGFVKSVSDELCSVSVRTF